MKITLSNGKTFTFDTEGSELETLMTAMLGAYGIKPVEDEDDVPENAEKVGKVLFFAEDGEDITATVIAGGKRKPVKYIYVSDDVHGKTVATHFFPKVADVTIKHGGDILTWIAPLNKWATTAELKQLSEYVDAAYTECHNVTNVLINYDIM